MRPATRLVWLPTALALVSSPAQAQVLVSETLTWKAKSGLSFNSCEGCKSVPVSIPGPGTITIRLQMEPYQRREWPNSSEAIVGAPDLAYVAEKVQTTYNGSRNVPPSHQMVGKPADLIDTWKYSQNKPLRFNVDIRSPLKCGGNDCDQRAATAQITVTFIPAGGSAPTQPSSTASAIGTWTYHKDGKPAEILTIEPAGGDFTVITKDPGGRILSRTPGRWENGWILTEDAKHGGRARVNPDGSLEFVSTRRDTGAVIWTGRYTRQGSVPPPAAPGGAVPVGSPAVPVTGPSGIWTRSEGGKVVDRIDITPSGDGFALSLREGDDRPLYASGFGVFQGSRLVSMTRNARTGNVGLVVITLQGEKIHYRSYYEDGRVAWEGEFFRRK